MPSSSSQAPRASCALPLPHCGQARLFIWQSLSGLLRLHTEKPSNILPGARERVGARVRLSLFGECLQQLPKPAKSSPADQPALGTPSPAQPLEQALPVPASSLLVLSASCHLRDLPGGLLKLARPPGFLAERESTEELWATAPRGAPTSPPSLLSLLPFHHPPPCVPRHLVFPGRLGEATVLHTPPGPCSATLPPAN